MKLACANCQTSYQVADEKIPASGARAKCPNCGHLILIPGTGAKDGSGSELMGRSGVDYGQTMAYDYSEVDQSQTEISALLEEISDREPFLEEGTELSLKDIQTGEVFPLPDVKITVGRSGNDINLDDPEVSRRHCVIRVFGDRIVIEDLKSTNGTHVNGKKIMTASLGASQQFTLGNTTLELVKKKVN